MRIFDGSILDFTSAIRLKPNDPETYLLRGIIYRETGKVDLAVRDEQMAASLRN